MMINTERGPHWKMTSTNIIDLWIPLVGVKTSKYFHFNGINVRSFCCCFVSLMFRFVCCCCFPVCLRVSPLCRRAVNLNASRQISFSSEAFSHILAADPKNVSDDPAIIRQLSGTRSPKCGHEDGRTGAERSRKSAALKSKENQSR